MAPKYTRRRVSKAKRATLHYALEVCDRTLLVTVISSKAGVDGKDGLEVMNIIKRSRELYDSSLTPLQGAVSLGYFNICKHLVEEGALLEGPTDVPAVPHPLGLSLTKGHYDIAHFLIDSGANVNMPFEEKLPLGFALDKENCPVDIVKHIIEAGFPVDGDVYIPSGKTALHAAVSSNHYEIVQYLLSLPSDPNKADKRGLTPLHYAIQKNYPDMVKLLAKGGAKIDSECIEHFTPMFYAIATSNYEMVKLLLSLGSDIHYVNGNKRCAMMPLHFAANFCKLKIVQLLLENGADVNRAVPLTGEIALHSATRADLQNSQQNKVSLDCIVELLIKEGSQLDVRHKFGWTPLQSAIKSKNLSVAKILIANGANLNCEVIESDNRRYSTFHLVAKTFDKELIKLSLDFGADYSSKDKDDLYPCHQALITTVVDTLAHSADCAQSLHGKNSNGDQELSVFKLFWKHGFPYDLTTEVKWLKIGTPCYPSKVAYCVNKQKLLFSGVKTQNARLVQKALSQGAEVRCYSKDLPNPLHYIAARGGEQILKDFVSRGFPVNMLSKSGETALHQAARGGHVNCCRVLLEYGAVYNYPSSKTKKTPQDLAKHNNHTEVVTLLSTVDKYFKEIKKGNFRKLKPDMKIFGSAMNCCHRDGLTLLGRALKLNMNESANKLMKLRIHTV